MKTFRFDDISINTDSDHLSKMVGCIRAKHPQSHLIFAISPCVFDTGGERVFPPILNVESDFRVFYKPTKVGIPGKDVLSLADGVASHGMIHVDHRLLDAGAQELSIVLSCALVGSPVFVPPFHKWNDATARVCIDNQIQLVRRHDRMVHLKYHLVTEDRDYYYLHTHDFGSMEEFEKQL